MGTRHATIVTDISYGDAGKGTVVDYLVRQARSSVIVRYNGGCQAAHNVVTPDGRHHTFAQFGSGSFAPGVKTHLSRFMLLNPGNMFREAEHLRHLGVDDIWQRLSVDQDAVIITPWHIAANRLRELARGDGRHGSTGQGVGEAKVDAMNAPTMALKAGELLHPVSLLDRLRAIRGWKYQQLAELHETETVRNADEWRVFTDDSFVDDLAVEYVDWTRQALIVPNDYLGALMREAELTVFEGAQGVLLDEWYGFQPYTTWSNTLYDNVLALVVDASYDAPVTRLGVMRAYTTRHGPGPLVTEDPMLTEALSDKHNVHGVWQGDFRVGYLDLVAHRYALSVLGGVDELAVTCLDRLAWIRDWKYCDAYRFYGDRQAASRFLEFNDSGSVVNIKPPDYGDYEQGCTLTQLLLSCEPVYRTIDMPPAASYGSDVRAPALLEAITGSLGSPVSLISVGPSAADKRALVAC